MNATDEQVHDNKMLPQLVEDITKSIKLLSQVSLKISYNVFNVVLIRGD
jgi:hypothetical protein